MLENFLPKGDDANQQWIRRGSTAAVVLVCYLVFLAVSRGPLKDIATVNFAAAAILWFYLPIGLILAGLGFMRATAWSVAAYPLAVWISEMISTPIYTFQKDLLTIDNLPQQSEPYHLGVWFAVAIFLYLTASATYVEWDETFRHRKEEPKPDNVPTTA